MRPLMQLDPQQTHYQYKPEPLRGEGKVGSPGFSSLSLFFFFDSCAESALFTTSAAASLQKEQRGPKLFMAAAAAADPVSHTDGGAGGGVIYASVIKLRLHAGRARTRSTRSLSTPEVNIQKEKGI